MEVRAELKYTKSHEWVKEEGGVWTIGLTDYAQSALGDLVFVNLPEAGDSVEAGEVFGDVESVKAVSDVYSPVTGEVEEINEELLDAPEKINGAPYDAWFIKVKDVSGTEELLSAEEYEAFAAIFSISRRTSNSVFPSGILRPPWIFTSAGMCANRSSIV